MPEQYLIDTHIYDKIVDTPGALALVKQRVAAGRVLLLSTHVQSDEIAATPDRERARLLATVPVELVLTSGAVYGTSAFGMARYGEPESFESLHGGNPKHTEDALIAATAQFEGATLVTEDVTLTKRATREGIAVIAWDVLYARLAVGGSTS